MTQTCLIPFWCPLHGKLHIISLPTQEDQKRETVCFGCTCDECGVCEDCEYGDLGKIPSCELAFEHTTSNGSTIDQLKIDAGYWRPTIDSVNIYECYYAKACRGGLTDAEGYCDEGYKGACKRLS